jgi:hypothetical protein
VEGESRSEAVGRTHAAVLPGWWWGKVSILRHVGSVALLKSLALHDVYRTKTIRKSKYAMPTQYTSQRTVLSISKLWLLEKNWQSCNREQLSCQQFNVYTSYERWLTNTNQEQSYHSCAEVLILAIYTPSNRSRK